MAAKAKPVAKAKKKQQKSAYEQQLQERYEYAQAIYEIQDADTRTLMSHMETKAQEMNGDFSENGARMARYIVVRLFVACAKWDIKMGKFKLPKKRCADCGVKVSAR